MAYIGSYAVYLIILILSVICGYKIEQCETENQERPFRIILFLVLWIPATIRYGIGTDYMHYVIIYDYINEFNDIEIGFRSICFLLNWIGADSFWMFTIIGALIYIPCCFGFPRKMMCSGTIMFVVTFYLCSYSLIRQALAVSFILYASSQLLEGRNTRFIVFTMLGSLFHLSALMILPFYFIHQIAEKRMVTIILCIIAGVLILNVNIVEKIFSNALFLASPYGRYASSEQFTQETQFNTGLGLLAKLFLPMIILIYTKRLEGKYKTGYISLICIAFMASIYIQICTYTLFRSLSINNESPNEESTY